MDQIEEVVGIVVGHMDNLVVDLELVGMDKVVVVVVVVG